MIRLKEEKNEDEISTAVDEIKEEEPKQEEEKKDEEAIETVAAEEPPKSPTATTTSSSEDKLVYMNEEGEIIVDPEHPEIRQSVEQALEELQNHVVTLPASDYVERLRVELETIRKERLQIDSTAPL